MISLWSGRFLLAVCSQTSIHIGVRERMFLFSDVPDCTYTTLDGRAWSDNVHVDEITNHFIVNHQYNKRLLTKFLRLEVNHGDTKPVYYEISVISRNLVNQIKAVTVLCKYLTSKLFTKLLPPSQRWQRFTKYECRKCAVYLYPLFSIHYYC